MSVLSEFVCENIVVLLQRCSLTLPVVSKFKVKCMQQPAVVAMQFPYILFMRMLFAATASHPMIVLEFRHISMRLCLRATEVDHAAHAVADIVKQQGFTEACVVGHSFGTFVASRLCQMHPAMVQSLVSMPCLVLTLLLSSCQELATVCFTPTSCLLLCQLPHQWSLLLEHQHCKEMRSLG